MKTVRRLLYRDIVWSVVFVAVAFLSLFFFIDVVDGLDSVAREGNSLARVMLRALLEVPGHFYELFPIAVLIGTIYSMARLAQSSEFTILRTGGLGPGRALALLSVPGIAFAALTFVVGDFVAPATEREAALLKGGGAVHGRGGAWLKERRSSPEGVRNVSAHVGAVTSAGELQGIRIFEFDADGRLLSQVSADRARVLSDGHWLLQKVNLTRWPLPVRATELAQAAALRSQALSELRWPSTLDAAVVAAALLPVQTMSTLELWRYSMHLTDQEQATQRHEIQFWKKALYPLACVVMVALALPFGYLHARAGGVSYKVFGGILLGISFVLLNNVSGHLGLLRQWTPWMVAAAPGLLYLLLSMAAFAWLVRYR
ncbi:MAG: LPS export ABC transporter permease LptG [Burkholderiaceae bacterium]|nr:LPS export ABC transporter permease LptG [Aquabacterium sp.]NUP85048.1 LPS export ABC transporter permease LptG [Burkholderiaceae bacterium]